jgi:ABC-type transporter Mla MlaB component
VRFRAHAKILSEKRAWFLPITLEYGQTVSVIHLEDEVDVSCSAELKKMLIEVLASEKALKLDLHLAGDLDITILQLLWAAERDAEKAGKSFDLEGSVPESIRSLIREAGFETFPAFAISEQEGTQRIPSATDHAND